MASGAAVGAALRTPGRAILRGLVMHGLGDWMPHQDNASRRFELVSGVAGFALLALGRGPLDAAVIGAVAGSCPDVEHIVRLPRPGGRKLFPSHRIRGWHRAGGLPAAAQLVAAGVLLGALLRPRTS